MSVLHDIIDQFIDLVPGLTQGQRDVMHELLGEHRAQEQAPQGQQQAPEAAGQDQEGPR